MTNEMPNEIYVTEPVKGSGTGFYAQTDFDGATKYIRADIAQPVNQTLLDGLSDTVNELYSEESGYWSSCSGCHQTDEGVPLGRYSKELHTHLGIGCRECGGIGAVWTETRDRVEEQTCSEYYVRNKQSAFLGNAPVWWSKRGHGYSAYLEKAERFTLQSAQNIVNSDPEKYEMWPCHLIDAETHTVFDWQAIGRVQKEMEKET